MEVVLPVNNTGLTAPIPEDYLLAYGENPEYQFFDYTDIFTPLPSQLEEDEDSNLTPFQKLLRDIGRLPEDFQGKDSGGEGDARRDAAAASPETGNVRAGLDTTAGKIATAVPGGLLGLAGKLGLKGLAAINPYGVVSGPLAPRVQTPAFAATVGTMSEASNLNSVNRAIARSLGQGLVGGIGSLSGAEARSLSRSRAEAVGRAVAHEMGISGLGRPGPGEAARSRSGGGSRSGGNRAGPGGTHGGPGHSPGGTRSGGGSI